MKEDTSADVALRVRQYARLALSASRYDHCERVATLCRNLCERFGVPVDDGDLAGISHDMCKAFKERLLVNLASRDGAPISAIEADKPSLLHGRAAAVLLSADFAVTRSTVIEAVRHHTFGTPGLDVLGKIVFVADKLEPGRECLGEERRQELLSMDLDTMTAAILADNVAYLESRGRQVSASTRAMLTELTEGRMNP